MSAKKIEIEIEIEIVIGIEKPISMPSNLARTGQS